MAQDDNGLKNLYLGYGGFCFADWHTSSLLFQTKNQIDTYDISNSSASESSLVYITGGNVNLTHNRPLQNTFHSPRGTTNVTQILLGPGTATITGSFNFDMNHKNIQYYLDENKIRRNTFFHLFINDSNHGYYITHNVWNSISFSASAGGLLTCAISYTSLNSFKDQIRPFSNNNVQSANSNYFENTLVAYWETGIQCFIDSFSLNFNQDVSPVYLNNTSFMPSYLRCGSLKVNANIDSCIGWQGIQMANKIQSGNSVPQSSQSAMSSYFPIRIGNKEVRINNALVDVQEYNHGGSGDLAKYSYQITGTALQKYSDPLFSIENVGG